MMGRQALASKLRTAARSPPSDPSGPSFDGLGVQTTAECSVHCTGTPLTTLLLCAAGTTPPLTDDDDMLPKILTKNATPGTCRITNSHTHTITTDFLYCFRSLEIGNTSLSELFPKSQVVQYRRTETQRYDCGAGL